MTKRAIIILAEGFEEIEAVTPIDLLRRAGIEVCVAGIHPQHQYVTGSHGIPVKININLDDITGVFDACILPGGLPGADNLNASEKVRALLKKMNQEKRIIAAICAAPAIVLAPLDILNGKAATCFPGMEETFSKTTRVSNEPVVADGHVVTSRGVGTAIDFSLKIIELLINKPVADSLRAKILAG